ncbi:MAG: hypothetical protein HGA47_13065 [Zoogloea sp.]|nr:hypothetical protein [Zoogloea sp.]
MIGNVADLWHAALDSRGQFFSADDPNGLLEAFTSILNRVQAGVGSAAAIVASSGKVTSSTAIYQAKYDGRNWSGDLIKTMLNADGTTGTSPWSAASQLKTPNASTRLILTSTDGNNGTGGSGVSFEWSNLTSNQKASLKNFGDSDTTAQARLNWLRGDATNEGTGLNFRVRSTTKLGDIINAGPVMVGMPNAGYSDNNFAGYSAFRFANCPTGNTFGACTGTRNAVIYFGANDGMVHGIDDASGNEVLAYVPMEVMGNLKSLSSAGYSHQTYVDAQPVAGDAYISGAWRTLLVGGLGAGGRGIYALNVTNPGNFNKNAASSGGADRLVYWEFTDANDADLGYTYGKPIIAKMANNQWAVIFGNGYNNTGSGKSALFIVFIESSLSSFSYKKITVGSGTTASPGGLGSPLAVDTDQDGKVNYIYAGDIDGKLWKFDVSNSSSANWTVANSGNPLFTATDASSNPQPITSAPEATLHPRGGVFVLFGTGKALQLSDLDPTNFKTQTFYGIWDNGSAVSLSNLEQRTFTQVTNTDGTVYRTLSGNVLDWTTKSGWYVNLPQSGERVLNDPILQDGKVIFTTAAPSTDPCKSAGDGWLIELDAITGQALPVSPFDVNNDGKFDINDRLGTTPTVPVGMKSTVGPGGAPLILNPDCTGSDCGRNTSPQYKYLTGNTGNIQQIKENWGITSGRLNWRDIMQ